MPFDLFVRPLWGEARVAASALERTTLPEGSVVKTIYSPGYRDRYAIVSGEELVEMCEAQDADDLKQRLADASGGVVNPSSAYLLHWEEWESGM